jgi:hypothetical protein
MSKKNNWLPNVRVDIVDMNQASWGYLDSTQQELLNSVLKDDYSRVLDGFRIQIADQGSFPGVFTVYNGSSVDHDGVFVSNKEDLDAQRSSTITADATYYIEIEHLETPSDTDVRGVWDPSYDNGLDDSGDQLPPGREFIQNVSTRITKDWKIVTPISTSGFELSTNPDSTKIPLAILVVSGGAITGVTTSPARTCLLESVLAGATTLKMVNTKLMPDSFTATLDIGGPNQETVSITANDRVNNLLTVSGGGVANNQAAGVRLAVAGVSPAQFLVERTATLPYLEDTSGDARLRIWQGNEDRGYVLGQDPSVTTGNSDSQIASLKDRVDFLAAQIRELKFGAQRTDDLGRIAPPNSYNASPRYFDSVPGLVGAKAFSITIGDGVTQWGDFNRTSYASDDLLLADAIAALPADGGTVFIKQGVVLDNFAATVDVPADTKVLFKSENFRNTSVVNIDCTDVSPLFNCLTANTTGFIGFENITINTDNAATSVVVLRDNWDLYVSGSAIVADGEGSNAVIDYTNVTTTTGRTTIQHSSFDVTSDGTTTTNGRAFIDADNSPFSNITIYDCDFVFENTLGSGCLDTLIQSTELRENVRLLNCHFDITGDDTVGIRLASSVDSGDTSRGRVIQGCSHVRSGSDIAFISSSLVTLNRIHNHYSSVGSTTDRVVADTDFAANVDVAGNLTMAINQDIEVSGTGLYKHGSRLMMISPVGGSHSGGGTATSSAGQITLTDATGIWYVPLHLQVGWEVESVSVYLEPAGSSTKTLRVRKIIEDGTATSAAVRVLTSSTESDYQITQGVGTGIPFIVEDDASYCIAFEAGDNGDIIRIIKVVYNQP